jgi:hypothetical protein
MTTLSKLVVGIYILQVTLICHMLMHPVHTILPDTTFDICFWSAWIWIMTHATATHYIAMDFNPPLGIWLAVETAEISVHCTSYLSRLALQLLLCYAFKRPHHGFFRLTCITIIILIRILNFYVHLMWCARFSTDHVSTWSDWGWRTWLYRCYSSYLSWCNLSHLSHVPSGTCFR